MTLGAMTVYDTDGWQGYDTGMTIVTVVTV
jgi:hypothetical protein